MKATTAPDPSPALPLTRYRVVGGYAGEVHVTGYGALNLSTLTDAEADRLHALGVAFLEKLEE